MNIQTEKKLIEMTLDEKLQLLTGADAFSTAAVDRLNVGKMEMHDSPFGVRVIKNQKHTQQNSDTVFLNTEKNTEYVSTAFMTGCAMGASFDREIIAKIGAAIGAQCRAYNISAILGPSMNIIRQPLCGRNFEYFSEDPVLSGELAAAYVSGVQSSSVAACPKHFIANNQERGRYHISSEIDERTMREIYLRPFEIMVKKSNPWSIMTAYNRINGIYASECRRLLRDILRDEWGFDGAVISDWGGCKNRAYSLIAGLDIAMPYAPEHFETLKKAYENGFINDIQIDESVRHILNMHEKTANQPAVGVAFEEHHLLAYDSACSSMTLLKNENKALPIDTKTVKNLLIIGTPAKEPLIGGDGSSKIKNPYKKDIPYNEIVNSLPDDVRVDYMGSMDLDPKYSDIGSVEGAVLQKAKQADAVIIFLAQSSSSNSEAVDRNSDQLDPMQEHLVRLAHVANKRVIVVLNIGSVVNLTPFEDCADAILVSWLSGEAMGAAVADTLLGKINPSGKLAQTFYRDINDVAAYHNYSYDMQNAPHDEGIMVGYRQFTSDNIKPLYAFGHGLSYTEFEYNDMSVNLCGDELTVSLQISNVGKVSGKEVVQLYFAPPKITLMKRPPLQLCGFDKISLLPGQKKLISIKIPLNYLKYYNPMLKSWALDCGIHKIFAGSASDDLRLEAAIDIKNDIPATEFLG